jgi:hypothetical protein
MTGPRQASEDTERVLAAAGIVVTDEGRARLADADARMSDAGWDDLRERYFRYADPA